MLDTYELALRECIADVWPGRENELVFGEGPVSPPLMLIGEAPGEQETHLGRPFVGKAGKNLDSFLKWVDMERKKIYITNAVKIRPTTLGKNARIRNRPPTQEEVALFRPWLMQEIALVNPRVIATLGNVPLQAVTASRRTVGELHGQILRSNNLPAPLVPLYHPASLIYNRSLATAYEQDMRALATYVRYLDEERTY